MDKNINVNGDIYGVGVAQDGSTINQDIHLPPHEIPKKLTPQTGLANDIDFVGRKEELQKVDELLNQNSMLLLLNGIGGIGKSTLASYYLNQHKDNFDYYGFVQVNEDIKLSLASAFGTSLDLKSEKIDDLFAEIMNKLQNLEGKKLLIIDDVKEMDNQLDEMNTLMTLKNSGFQILFTSRETKEYIPQYFLDIMSIEDARELFLKHYPTNEMDKVDKILEYLDYHTLFIEMTARMLNNRQNSFSIDKLEKKFNNGQFTKIEIEDEKSFLNYLNRLFTLEKLSKSEILLLKRLSIYPSIEIDFEYFSKIFAGVYRIDAYKEELGKNKIFRKIDDDIYELKIFFFSYKVTFNELLESNGLLTEEKLELYFNKLVKKGWLIKNNNKYKLHQIIKEYILENHTPKYKEIHHVFCQSCWNLQDINSSVESAINNKNYLIYFESIKKALEIIDSKYINFIWALEKFLPQKGLKFNKNSNIINFYDNLADWYHKIGRYSEALTLQKKALNMSQKLFKKNSLITSSIGYRLATIYLSIKDYEKALFFSKESLAIVKKVSTNLEELSPYYHIVFAIYKAIGEYEKAEEIIKKILSLYELKYNKNSIHATNYYLDLARIHSSRQEHDKALEIATLFLKKQKRANGKNSYNVSSIYAIIAQFYKVKGDYKKALINLNKALNILKKKFPNDKKSQAVIYFKLGNTYWHMEKCNEAIAFFEKSMNLYIDLYGKNHPNIIDIIEQLAMLYACNYYKKGKMNSYEKGIFYFNQIIEIKEKSSLIDVNVDKERLDKLKYEVSLLEDFYKNLNKYDIADIEASKDNPDMISFRLIPKQKYI